MRHMSTDFPGSVPESSPSVSAGRQPQVDYALTERGRSLLRVVRDLAGWADGHAEEISVSRAEYDARGE
ncbi:winged helix-turn-helix transcriptional regulator [Streptomyces sp. NPDC002619]|uniref:winged helix-turn-helix transcriptional regulator n=1 Tax=Streptomyces sp. NPDC002619 TaxID=3364655 RepID=UPI0036B035F6